MTTDTQLELSASHPLSQQNKSQDAMDDSSGTDKINSPDSLRVDMTPIRFLAIISLAACFTGSQITGYLIGPGINFIGNGLHIGTERSWIIISGSLASAVAAPCAGYIQDLIGRRACLAFALLCTLVGNIVSATSNGFIQSVTGSTLTGMGSVIQELTAVAAVAELVPVRKRGFFLALNVVMSLGFVPGVLYAQLLSSGSNWRWLFWISFLWNFATAVGLTLSYFRMRVDRLSRPSDAVKLRQIDWIGIILLIVGLTLFLIALQSGGRRHPWSSAYVLVQLIVGLAVIGVMILWESRGFGRPLIPFRLFYGQRIVGLVLPIAAMSGINYSTVLNLGPTFIQTTYSETKVGYGLLALGPGLGLVVGAVLGNVLISVVGQRSREIMATGTVIMTIFTGAEAMINPDNPTTFAIISSFAAFGIGFSIIPTTTIVTLACPEDLIGTAVALTITIRSIGGTIGYTILYNIFLSHSATTIPNQMAPRLSAAGLEESAIATFIRQYIDAVAGGNMQDLPPANASVLAAAQEGFRWGTSQGAQLVYYASIAFGVVAILLSICLPNMKQYITDKVLVRSKGQNPH